MNVAFIPVRGGSKSIPLKNIKNLNGKPLVYWTVKAACECKYIDRVYVATDSDMIKEKIEDVVLGDKRFDKLEIIGRSRESASDTASTEFAMLEFAEKYEFDNIFLIQATSPLLKSHDLEEGYKLFCEPNTDSVLSVVRQYRFIWNTVENGNVNPINYDTYNRPRRQNFDGYLMENGAFYISSKKDLLYSGNRISGNIKAYEMEESTAYEIDEITDWYVVETLMKNDLKRIQKMPIVRMLLTDCDGCLTDGGMYYSESGDEMKKFNTRDGMAFSLLKKEKIITGIITGEDRELNKRRAEKLGIDIYKSGCTDKLSEVKLISDKYNVPLENIAYIGDDINDYEIMLNVGYACCPSDAVEKVKSISHYIANTKGGAGVIREVADNIISNMRY